MTVEETSPSKSMWVYIASHIHTHTNTHTHTHTHTHTDCTIFCRAESVKCNYWQHPDRYGHYRTAAVTAIKHHWWWKINKVFDDLNVTANFNGTVFFMEEDHYISPDAVLVAQDLIHLKDRYCG